MDMNIDEQWLDLPRVRNRKDIIVAISNTGKYRRFDGTIGILERRHHVKYYGKLEYCSRIIADHFLITVKRTDQNQIDHCTHFPNEYNVNDVRNLRWCTQKENLNFDEAISNLSGENNPWYRIESNKHSSWKGNDVGPAGAYYRALKEYRSNPTQENLASLEEARLNRREYLHHLRRAKKLRQ